MKAQHAFGADWDYPHFIQALLMRSMMRASVSKPMFGNANKRLGNYAQARIATGAQGRRTVHLTFTDSPSLQTNAQMIKNYVSIPLTCYWLRKSLHSLPYRRTIFRTPANMAAAWFEMDGDGLDDAIQPTSAKTPMCFAEQDGTFTTVDYGTVSGS